MCFRFRGEARETYLEGVLRNRWYLDFSVTANATTSRVRKSNAALGSVYDSNGEGEGNALGNRGVEEVGMLGRWI